MKYIVAISLWAIAVPAIILAMSFIQWSNQFKLIGTPFILRLMALYVFCGVVVSVVDKFLG
ncbi:hypothetical protein EFZ10_08610 [Tatumella sp. TA1]|nr:hypothetical protein EFZ10_08610 [Tatumella sp. TA1]